MPRVFLVQEPLRRDRATGAVMARFDLSKLERYGKPVYLTSWSELRDGFRHTEIMRKLRDKLADFCDEDYVVPVGNPALIAMAMLVAADINEGRVRVLDWMRDERTYRLVPIDMGWFPYAPDVGTVANAG